MKITIFGAGNVGATTAKCIADAELAKEIVLFDVVEGMPQGKALDMSQSMAVNGIDISISGTNSYEDTANSDIVVITAGIARKPGMTREDLLNTNAKIVGDIAEQSAKVSPKAVYIVVTNPLDVMTQLVYKRSKLAKGKVVGMAGVLDNSRFRLILAKRLGVSAMDVNSLVLGSHGDTMVPILSRTSVSGAPIEKLIPAAELAELVIKARDGGAEIVKLLKTGSAYYAPAQSVTKMVSAIVKDKNETVAASALCEGEYGIKGTFVGVPTKLNRNGVAGILEVPLTADELKALQHSAAVVKENCDILSI